MKSASVYLITALIMIGTFSCSRIPDNVKQTLELAGENRKELEHVIEHYQSPADSLKLKAAYFLIGNMVNKYYYPYNKAQQQHLNFIDSLLAVEEKLKLIQSKEEYDKTRKKLHSLIVPKWKEIEGEFGMSRTAPIRDIETITSQILIENIDYAFMVWEKVPWSNRYTFDQFCEFVLPYRTAHDIPGLWRKKINQKFSWVLDSLKGSDFLYAAKLINDNEDFGWEETMENFSHVSISDLYSMHRGVCRQHTSWKIAALRSIGIPVADAYGHQSTSWAIVPDLTGNFYGWEAYTPPGEGSRYIADQRYTNYSKIYRSTYKIQPFPFSDIAQSDIPTQFFNINQKDITKDQSDAMDVSLELSIPPPDKTDYVYLCVFNRKKKTWEAAHWSKVKNNQGYFDQMGLGCIYLPMYYLNHKYYPAGKPIYLNKKGGIVNFENNSNAKELIKIYRKFDLNFWENRYANLMMSDVFEGSNNKDFRDSEILFEITNQPLRMEEEKTITNKKFRYVRYRSTLSEQMWKNSSTNFPKWDYLNIAEISFYDENEQFLNGRVMASSSEHLKNSEKAFDKDIRTNFVSTTLCWIGLDLGRPTKVSKVKYLFQNSFNTIERGDEYELLYWDNEWKSLGKQVAIDIYVEYNVPKNAVMWLRNLTKGKEEQVFFIDGNKQIWG